MAGGRIKGITIELNGDATNLTEALAKVDHSAKQSQANLKDINKLLKFEPGNTELLQQKFKNLDTAIKSTDQRLQALNEAASQMKLAGKDSGPEWDALQREIVETEAKLKSLTGQMEEFGSVGAQKVAAAGEKVKDVSQKLGEVGTTLTTHVTMPIVGLGTAAVAAASEFDAGMSKVQAISGATGDEMQQLRDKALEMGNKTKFSATDAASAMEYMAMAGWKTEAMLGGIEGVMDLAAASGEDLARTSDIVTDALTAFGKEADQASHFADILAVTSSGANTNVGMMGETFKYAAPIAGSFGYEIEDVALAIGLMANAGTKSSQAGTALRGILTSLNGTIKITGKELGTVEIQTANADGSMRELNDILMDCRAAFSHLSESEKASVAEMLVGKNAMSGFLGIMNASDETVRTFADGLANCDGAAKRMSETMNDNLEGQLTILKGQLQTLGISFGQILVPVLRDVVAMLQGVVSWLNSLNPATKEMIVRIAAVAAAVGPLLLVISKIGGAIGTVMTWAPKIVTGITKVHGLIGKLGPAISSVVGVVKTGFSTVMGLITAHPIIAAITAVVAGLVFLYTHCEWFRDAVNSVIQAVIGFFQRLPETWENIKAAAETIFTAIAEFFTNTWAAITANVQEAWTAISEFFTTTWTNITTGVTTAWTNITMAIQTAMTTIQTLIITAWNTITTAISTALSAIGSAVSSAWNSIRSTVTTTMSNIKSNVTAAWENIKSTVTTVLSNIGSAITNGFNTAKNNVTNALNAIKNTIKNVWDGAVSIVRGAVDKLKSLVNFHWELPKLKLPHFKITGSFSLNPPSVPHLSVEWYKKAMENGMILNSPTIFGAAGGHLLGGGEAGPEAVVGVESLRDIIRDSMREGIAGLGGDIVIPVSIGQQRVETIVLKAIQRYNFRSGGR